MVNKQTELGCFWNTDPVRTKVNREQKFGGEKFLLILLVCLMEKNDMGCNNKRESKT